MYYIYVHTVVYIRAGNKRQQLLNIVFLHLLAHCSLHSKEKINILVESMNMGPFYSAQQRKKEKNLVEYGTFSSAEVRKKNLIKFRYNNC